jgi:hypothetical protein
MEWYWWVSIVIVGGVGAIVLLQTLTGAAVNITTAARLYLSSELKKLGIRQLIPDQLVDELADQASGTAAAFAKMNRQSQLTAKAEMIQYVDSQVMMLGLWLRGDGLVKNQKGFVATVGKYGIPFGLAGKHQ